MTVVSAFWLYACATSTTPLGVKQVNERIARALDQGAVLYRQGCYTQALQLFEEAHELAVLDDDQPSIAAGLNGIANVYYQTGDDLSAIAVFAEALHSYAALHDQDHTIRVLANQAAALVRLGRLDEAAIKLTRADTLAAPHQRLAMLRLKNRALLALARQQTEQAESLLNEALKQNVTDDRTIAAATQYTLGRLQLDTNRAQEALTYLRKALAGDRSAGNSAAVAQDLAALGDCYARLENHTAAAEHYRRSIKMYALLHNKDRVEALREPFKANARKVDMDIEAALHWVDRWLAGETETGLCR